VGTISPQSKDSVQYRVASLKDLNGIIIPHFDKYPLLHLLPLPLALMPALAQHQQGSIVKVMIERLRVCILIQIRQKVVRYGFLFL
jgi:hypothetical protein